VHFGGEPSDNLFVAGEMMAGNVLGQGYTAGVGMTIGTAFGRIAGERAAAAARAQSGPAVRRLPATQPQTQPATQPGRPVPPHTEASDAA
jgi:succinate dehydrogenase/fumarate reductase flavoprotein subunit